MTWTKISDSMPDDPRLLRLPRELRWMHLEGLVWCNKHATDGHIPGYAIRSVTDQTDPEDGAAQIVESGLWEFTDNGWFIAVFSDDQPSAADQAKAKEYDRQRQRRQRMHRSGDHSECDPKYCEASRVTAGVTDAVSNGVSHGSPPRPDPTRPEGEGKGGKGKAGGSASSGGSAPLAPSSTPPPRPMWDGDGPPPGVTPTVTVTTTKTGRST